MEAEAEVAVVWRVRGVVEREVRRPKCAAQSTWDRNK